MRAHRNYRSGMVNVTMPLAEFREHVEWLEEIADRDGCTADWREWLDDLDPPGEDQA